MAVKVGHFSIRSDLFPGPWHSTVELIAAEKELGLESELLGAPEIIELTEKGTRKVDVLVLHTVLGDTFWGKTPWAKRTKTLLYLRALPEHAMGVGMYGDPYWPTFWATSKLVDVLVAQSERAATVYHNMLRRDVSSVKPGVDLEQWTLEGEAARLRGDPPIWCGDWATPFKNPVAAWPHVPSGAVLRCIARDDVAKAWPQDMPGIDMGPRVEKVDRYYRACPITVATHPFPDRSRSEMEAAACGSYPCRPTEIPGLVSVWRDDPEELKERARSLAVSHFDIKDMAESFRKIYESVME